MLLVIFLLILSSAMASQNVFGKISKIFGIDHAKSVAELVSEAFGKRHEKGESSDGNIFSGFLRLLGFDAKKIGAIAINGIIFVAQLIGSSFSRQNLGRSTKDGSPYDWLISNPEVIKMFSHLQDKELPQKIILFVKERTLDEDTDCLQLLICKGSPFIWGMQKVFDRNITVKGMNALYAYLPNLEEVIDNSDKCDRNHPYCFIHL